MSDQSWFVIQIKLIWLEAEDIKFRLISRNHSFLKILFPVADPKY